MADDRVKSSHSMAEMSSHAGDDDLQALHLQSSEDCKKIHEGRHPTTLKRTLSQSQVSPSRRLLPAASNTSKSKSRIRRRRASIEMNFLVVCCCFYLLSATGSTDVASSDGGDQGSKKRFLRTAVATAAEADSIENESASSESSGHPGYVTEPSPTEPSPLEDNEEEEEFDYETYHAKHNIPVPALGATMMGLMNANILTTTKSDDTASSANDPPQQRILEEEVPMSPSRGILAFAGTSEAMKSFASTGSRDERIPLNEMDEEKQPINTNTMMFESTLAQISKSRYSLLYGLDSSEKDGDEGTSNDSTTASKSESQNDQQTPSQKKTPILNNQMPRLPSSDSDLDRGRHLVGLEIREVRPHQQIIIDYQDASASDNSGSEEQVLKPLRIKYMLSDNVELNTGTQKSGELENNVQLLSSLMETSFNKTATLWSQALSLPPVVGNIIPTVTKCGGAQIPALHREEGIQDADSIIYISGDNRYCGGALMHSAICDFDQNMRPLVANINICTKNIPTIIDPAYGDHIITTTTLAKYDGYISTELSRILGASTSLFRHYQNPDTGASYGSSEKHANCVDGTQETVLVPNMISEEIDANSGEVYYEIRTPKVIEVVRNHFDCMTLTGARLEVKKGGLSCFGSFLDERLFFGEQVSGFQVLAGHQGAIISPLTLALLEDSSWYTANYTVSSEVSFGRGAGCQFAHGSCKVDESGYVQVSAQGKGFHCTDIGSMGCDVTHSFKAKCDLVHPSSDSFIHHLARGHSSLNNDVCPMYVRGAIDCIEATSNPTTSLPGEVYGQSSKCFLTDEGEPICLRGMCNEDKQSIDIHYEDEVLSCEQDGQIIDTKKGLRIECPRLAAICPSLICPSNCSGRGVCDEDREGKHSCICDDPFDESPGCWGQ